jgi:DNA-directed RNA polymerase subunit RPC12/RpoP
MQAVKIIAYIAAAILIFFGILFIWGAFSQETQGAGASGVWIITGVISVGIGFGLIWFASRQKQAVQGNNVTLKVDLPANVSMDSFKCQSCGGALSPENVKMVAGAPVVSCPYCNTTYQLTEEPKW